MTREERLNLILTFARVLYINGESTQKTLDIAERMSNSLGFRTTIFPHWGELEVQTEGTNSKLVSVIEAVPSGVDMGRVASTLKMAGDLCNGRLVMADAMEVLNRI